MMILCLIVIVVMSYILRISEDHEDNLEYAMSETQKNISVKLLGKSGLKFLYYCEMLPFYKEDAPKSLKEDLRVIVDKCYLELTNALKGI